MHPYLWLRMYVKSRSSVIDRNGEESGASQVFVGFHSHVRAIVKVLTILSSRDMGQFAAQVESTELERRRRMPES